MPAHRQTGANHRRNGNDVGLVAPSRKSAKQQQQQSSFPHVNGLVLDHLAESPPLTSAVAFAQTPIENEGTSIQSGGRSHSDPYIGRLDVSMDGETDAAAGEHNASSQHALNGHTAKDDQTNAGSSLVESVSTIVSVHCRLDMLAMLFVILHLPIYLQIIVHLAFTWLTVGNPTASWLNLSLPTFLDWSRSQGGNPSVAVSVVANLIFFCIWALLPFGKDFILGLAPAVMAVSLSGATSGQDSWKHASLCTLSIFIHNIIVDNYQRHRLMNLLWLCLSKLSFSPVPIPRSASIPSAPSDPIWHWWNYLLLACQIHIVTRGIIHLVRRWVDNQGGRRAGSKSEHDSGPLSAISLLNVPPDLAADGQSNGSTDGRHPGPSPASQRTLSSGKRRKKQANYVKSQQPFWAAFANTRINKPGENKINLTKKDSVDAAASVGLKESREPDGSSSGSGDRAWVTEIRSTEVWFQANLSCDGDDSSDLRQPLDIRVNYMHWPSCVFASLDVNSTHGQRRVEGQILDLNPSLNHHIEIIRSKDQAVIYSQSVFTGPAANIESHGDVLQPVQEIPQAPSQASAAKKALQRDQANLNEQKAKSSKAHASHQRTIRNLKAEVENAKRSLETSEADRSQRSRKQMFQTSRTQSANAVKELSAELDKLGEIPASETQAFQQSSFRHGEVLKRQKELKAAIEQAKKETNKNVTTAQHESARVRTKKDKANARLTSLIERHKITTEEIGAKRRTRAETEANTTAHLAQQHQHVFDIYHGLEGLKAERQDLRAKMDGLQHQFAQPAVENPYAAINARQAFGLGFQPHLGGLPLMHSRQDSLRHRQRSSSMLSAMSGLTENNVNDANGRGYAIEEPYRDSRNGSGSSGSHPTSSPAPPKLSPTGQSSFSYRDFASSPAPPKLSPIGHEVGRSSPRAVKR